ncbi:MAG: molecular chaperone HtpG [Bdellovibrionales bacterium]|nr:molecular chaperone HtpG [Bdellovibrionales bacterium]
MNTFQFQTEISELLNLMIHSLYSHKEIFLRELVSNASDAIDKLQFEALTQPQLIQADTEFQIRLTPDAVANTLTIEDNGVGMTEQEVQDLIGTIARSGSKKWAEMKKEVSGHPELIGQFGVGFYSAFMVAEKVTLHTQKAGATGGTVWISEGKGQYTLESRVRTQGHGTTITLHLRAPEAKAPQTDEANDSSAFQDFTDEWTLKSLVKKYSDFIRHPIKMKTSDEVPRKNEKGEEIPGEFDTVVTDETLNSQKALWLKSPSEVTAAEREEFYKQIAHDWEAPAKTIHFKAEGNLEYSALMYVPNRKPMNYGSRENPYGLQLYVKRVFIMGDCKEALPEYLRFVKGVVDSSDLSLNVSREILQKDQQALQIKKSLTGKILSHLKDWKTKDSESYLKFWKEFGPTVKEGFLIDATQSEKLQDLCLFQSSQKEGWTSLEEYVAAMPETQKEIYYLSGESLEWLKASPHLEKAKEKNYNVLLMTDPVDEWLPQTLREYKGKKLVSLAKDSASLLTDDEKKKVEENTQEQAIRFKELLQDLGQALEDRVKEAKLSTRLINAPACLVSGEWDPSMRMERIMEAMGQGRDRKVKRVLEINGAHPLLESLIGISKEDLKPWAEVLYGQACLSEGLPLTNPHQFNEALTKVMTSARPTSRT